MVPALALKPAWLRPVAHCDMSRFLESCTRAAVVRVEHVPRDAAEDLEALIELHVAHLEPARVSRLDQLLERPYGMKNISLSSRRGGAGENTSFLHTSDGHGSAPQSGGMRHTRRQEAQLPCGMVALVGFLVIR
jgi:hypothetical protein